MLRTTTAASSSLSTLARTLSSAMAAPPLTVTFVRHGESMNNILHSKLGQNNRADFELRRNPDPPLSDRGVAQAQAAGRRAALEEVEATLVLTAYLHRALRTADELVKGINEARTAQELPPARVRVERDIHEHGGMYTATRDADSKQFRYKALRGRTAAELVAEFPHFEVVPAQNTADGWWHRDSKEERPMTQARAKDLMKLLTREAKLGEHKRIVIVTHGDFYYTFMDQAMEHGFVTNPPETNTLLTNTAFARFAVVPAEDKPFGGVAEMLLEGCDAHLDSVGRLDAAWDPKWRECPP